MRQKPDPLESHPSLGPLFEPVKTGPLYRKSDPYTSRLSAAEMRGSARLAALHRLVLDLVQQHPGCTANELARIAGASDPRRINRRLSELEKAGHVKSAGTKVDPITNRRGLRWWPT